MGRCLWRFRQQVRPIKQYWFTLIFMVVLGIAEAVELACFAFVRWLFTGSFAPVVDSRQWDWEPGHESVSATASCQLGHNMWLHPLLQSHFPSRRMFCHWLVCRQRRRPAGQKWPVAVADGL
ncbi:hypothetical protein V8F33_012677 [Rhypophila sp. PSN 637]